MPDLERTAREGSFEEAFRALERVVQRLEEGGLAMTEAVDLYETGLRLSRRCAELLEQAELRIRTIEEIHSSGSVAARRSAIPDSEQGGAE